MSGDVVELCPEYRLSALSRNSWRVGDVTLHLHSRPDVGVEAGGDPGVEADVGAEDGGAGVLDGGVGVVVGDGGVGAVVVDGGVGAVVVDGGVGVEEGADAAEDGGVGGGVHMWRSVTVFTLVLR